MVLDGGFVRLTSHEARFSPEDEAAWDEISALLGGDARFQPPRVRDIAKAIIRPERKVRRLLKLASRMGRADEVAQDHFFQRIAVREMMKIIMDMDIHAGSDGFTAASFRDRLGNGRKVAIQILEYFDRQGVTVRHGDLRRANRRRAHLFDPLAKGTGDTNEDEPVSMERWDGKSGRGNNVT